ncbi:MAG: DegT/DnrJ/EryC1/StrS family aminotransferase [Candidatus Omnitrophota bacterium]
MTNRKGKEMSIPLLDLKAQYQTIKSEINEVLGKVVESQYFILSPEVSSLEAEIADYTGVPYAAGVASGTDAIILALKGLGVGPGDMVITTPFTFFATAESISILGAKPLFVDVDPQTYNIDPDKVENLLEEIDVRDKCKIKAIIPVHLYGQCADMTRIMEIAKKHDLKIVEDCAQAIGAVHNGKKAGSFGNAGCFSFFPSKNLGGFGDGGMIVTSDRELIERIKKLRVHGSREQYIHDEIGYNSRLDSLQAAILRIKLRKLDKWFKGRQAIAAKYEEAFAPLGIATPKIAGGNIHTYHQYTIALDDRNGLIQYLKDKGVSARIYYPVPLHLQPCYKGLEYSIGSFPVSEKMAERVVSLPVYPELTDESVQYIIQAVTDFIKKKA